MNGMYHLDSATDHALRGRSSLLLGYLLLLTMAISGCAVLHREETEDSTELRYTNWWNYYQRGIHLLAQGNEQAAQEDFERCLGLRDGANYAMAKDLWRIRTYGMHFLEGYFPHRELGIAHFRLGNAEEAMPLLETSLHQTPSGRAKTYLNRARKSALSTMTVPPPVAKIGAGSRDVWTRERFRNVSGVAQADGFVKDIHVNQQQLFIELAEKDYAFDEQIALSSGTNWVHVTVTDLLGQQTQTNLLWIADWSPPHLDVHRIQKQGPVWILEGVCYDDYRLEAITVDGKSISGNAKKGGDSTDIQLRIPVDSEARFEATDAAQNRLTCTLKFEDFQATPFLQQPQQYVMVLNDHEVLDAPPSTKKKALSSHADKDRLPPQLRLACQARVTVFDHEFFLDGEAEDRGGLASIRINGEEVLSSTEGRPPIRKYFSRRLSLGFETNDFEVVATDLIGNEIVKHIQVCRKKPDYTRDEYRLTVGLPPLYILDNHALAGTVRHHIEKEILRDPIRFALVERDEGWDYILRELRLNQSDLAQRRAALRVREMLPAELLFVGTVTTEDQGITIRIKVLECEQGRLLASDDIYTENVSEEIAYQAAGLVMKIEQRFPILEGRITKKSGKRATLDLGEQHGAWPGATFLVLEQQPSGSVGGYKTIRSVEDVPIELRLSRATRAEGIAHIHPSSAQNIVQEGDHVYSR